MLNRKDLNAQTLEKLTLFIEDLDVELASTYGPAHDRRACFVGDVFDLDKLEAFINAECPHCTLRPWDKKKCKLRSIGRYNWTVKL